MVAFIVLRELVSRLELFLKLLIKAVLRPSLLDLTYGTARRAPPQSRCTSLWRCLGGGRPIRGVKGGAVAPTAAILMACESNNSYDSSSSVGECGTVDMDNGNPAARVRFSPAVLSSNVGLSEAKRTSFPRVPFEKGLVRFSPAVLSDNCREQKFCVAQASRGTPPMGWRAGFSRLLPSAEFLRKSMIAKNNINGGLCMDFNLSDCIHCRPEE